MHCQLVVPVLPPVRSVAIRRRLQNSFFVRLPSSISVKCSDESESKWGKESERKYIGTGILSYWKCRTDTNKACGLSSIVMAVHTDIRRVSPSQ